MIIKRILQYVMHIAYLLMFVYKNYINIEKVNIGYSMVQNVEYGIYITCETGFFLKIYTSAKHERKYEKNLSHE